MKKIKLRDVLFVKRGTSLSGKYYSETGDKIRLTLGNFDYPGGGFKTNDSKDNLYFTGPVKPEFVLKEGDIITPLTEQVRGLLGTTAVIPESGKYIQSGDVGLIVPDERKIDKRFADYLISSPMVKKQLDANSQQTKIRHTSPQSIMNCVAFLPNDINEQHKIASLLDLLNAKIRINRHINDNLEQIINLVYHYRFFGFVASKDKPTFMSGSFRESLPSGWRICKLKEIAELTMGQSPKSSTYNSKRIGLPLINGAAELQKQGISIEKYTSAPARVCRSGDILFCIRATLGNVQFANREYCLGRGVAALRPKKDIYREYVYLAIRDYLDAVASNLSGSIIVGLSKEDIEDLSIPLPPLEELKSFSEAVSPMVDKIYRNRDEAIQIAKARDDFFPLLINGQIRVFD